MLLQNSTVIPLQPWFVPIDVFMILCSLFAVLLALVLLFTTIVDKTCHTIPIMLVANSSLTALIVACVTLSMSIFTLHNDLRQIQYQDSLCVLRAYIGYASYGAMNYSFFLQALYRYVCVVHPTRLFYQSFQFQGPLIVITWLIGCVYPFPFLFTHYIVYNVDDQICQKPLGLSFYEIYGATVGYVLPILFLILVYSKLVQYVKEMGKNVVAVNTLTRARRELKMARRIIILVFILLTVCFPFTLIMLMAFFNPAPKYHFRISYIFVDASVLSVMICSFQFTDPLKASIMKRMKIRPNIVVSRMT